MIIRYYFHVHMQVVSFFLMHRDRIYNVYFIRLVTPCLDAAAYRENVHSSSETRENGTAYRENVHSLEGY